MMIPELHQHIQLRLGYIAHVYQFLADLSKLILNDNHEGSFQTDNAVWIQPINELGHQFDWILVRSKGYINC